VILDAIGVGQGVEVHFEGCLANVEGVQIPFQAGEEQFAAAIDVVGCMRHASVVSNQELRDAARLSSLKR